MYRIILWHQSLNLKSFYEKSYKKGYLNNINQKVMIDDVRESVSEWKGFVLYRDLDPVGFCSLHSISEIDPNGYRIMCRLAIPDGQQKVLRKYTGFYKHDHLTDQFLLPACLNAVNGNHYITTNESPVASQRLVHKLYMPNLVKNGLAEKKGIIQYRGHEQTLWLVYKDKFLQSLEKHKWNQ